MQWLFQKSQIKIRYPYELFLFITKIFVLGRHSDAPRHLILIDSRVKLNGFLIEEWSNFLAFLEFKLKSFWKPPSLVHSFRWMETMTIISILILLDFLVSEKSGFQVPRVHWYFLVFFPACNIAPHPSDFPWISTFSLKLTLIKNHKNFHLFHPNPNGKIKQQKKKSF